MADLLSVPFEVGHSPFHIKGNSYRGHMRFIGQQIAGGLPAMLAALPSDPLRQFAGQTFLPGGWYDFLPYAAICRTSARIRGVTYLQHLDDATRWQFKDDLNGIYRTLLRVVGPRSVANRITIMASNFFDFGSAKAVLIEDKRFEAIRTGVPHSMIEWQSVVTSAYLEEAVSCAGGLRTRAQVVAIEDDGFASGVSLKRARFRLTWD